MRYVLSTGAFLCVSGGRWVLVAKFGARKGAQILPNSIAHITQTSTFESDRWNLSQAIMRRTCEGSESLTLARKRFGASELESIHFVSWFARLQQTNKQTYRHIQSRYPMRASSPPNESKPNATKRIESERNGTERNESDSDSDSRAGSRFEFELRFETNQQNEPKQS